MSAPLAVKCPDAIHRVRTSALPRYLATSLPRCPLLPVTAQRLSRPCRASAAPEMPPKTHGGYRLGAFGLDDGRRTGRGGPDRTHAGRPSGEIADRPY